MTPGGRRPCPQGGDALAPRGMDRRHSAMVHSRFLLFFTCIPLMVSARFLFAFLFILCCPLLESGGVSRHILGHLALQAHREPHAPHLPNQDFAVTVDMENRRIALSPFIHAAKKIFMAIICCD